MAMFGFGTWIKTGGMTRPSGNSAAEDYLRDLRQDPLVLRMKNYLQHGRVSTYEHCENVAKACVRLNCGLRLHAEERTMVRAAMLHDFYLYD